MAASTCLTTAVSARALTSSFPAKASGGFDPVQYAGQEATFIGMLQNGASKSGKTLFWTAVVRRTADVCLKPKPSVRNVCRYGLRRKTTMWPVIACPLC